MENKNEKKIILPLYETNPICFGEKTSEKAEELGVKLAKEWVDKNHL